MSNTDVKKLNLRLPADLKNWLEHESKKNMRSLNSEIVFRLRECMTHTERVRRSPGRQAPQ
ncbi:Arc family DNA-binding protein [Paraburkholderia sp. 2C]